MNSAPQAFAAEWLEADGFGGFASGTVCGVRTRRYHALLLAATTPPTGRMVLVNGLVAWVEDQTGISPLFAQYYAPGVQDPAKAADIRSFQIDPWPRWDLAGGGDSMFRHEIFVVRDSCETVLRWRREQGVGPSRLHVRLLISGRDYHALHHENPAFRFGATLDGGNVSWSPYPGVPDITALTNGNYVHAPDWYRRFLYTEERARGLDDREDLASPGVLSFDLASSEAIIVLRTGHELGVCAQSHAALLSAQETKRRALGKPHQNAAASYNVVRGAGRTLIAGFPWFTDWGRDTFIAMRGLLLAQGELQAAQAILVSWASVVSDGMLPNRFPDSGSAPEYNSVDASLWYIVAVHDFRLRAAAYGYEVPTPDAAALTRACDAILVGYSAGTRFGIKADADGLLKAGSAGIQMTWMDAITEGRVVTPRIGKPVEIQALWINALEIGGPRWAVPATRARAAFAARFANPAGGLFDVVDADHVSGSNDASIRPNQILAVGGLPFPVLSGVRARDVVDLVETKLLTPLGLRTLSPDDPAYKGRYGGNPAARDGAYHQGTAWPWLLGPFVDAWLAVRGRNADAKAQAAARFLPPLLAHLQDAGLGHISEVVDGGPPHKPGGCPFQAWSLGEYIRIREMLA